MEPHGLKEPLEQQSISLESPTETDSSWRWVIQDPSSTLLMEQEPSSPLLMEPHGLKEPLEHQIVSMESPMETDSS